MNIVLESARLDGSVSAPVALKEQFPIVLVVSPEKPGVVGAEGVTLSCDAADYSLESPLVVVAIPEGAQSHEVTVRAAIAGPKREEDVVVTVRATAGNTFSFSVQIRGTK